MQPLTDHSQSVYSDRAWVKESRFGNWFQSTNIWSRFVMGEALERLIPMIKTPLPTHPSILDAGCGQGIAFGKLCQAFTPQLIVGTDIDEKLIARARIVAENTECRVDTFPGNVMNLQIESSSFDIVFCHQSLHHVNDQESTLAEFRRVLRPDGILMLAESCRSFTLSPIIKTLFRHPEENQRSADEFLDLLNNAGFTTEKDCVSTPDIWWARPGMGLLQLLGMPRTDRPAPLLLAIARPA